MTDRFLRNSTLIALALILAQTILLARHHMPHSIWYDEGLTLNIVQRSSLSEVLHGAMTLKPFPPLYFFLVHASFRLIAGELGLRLISLIFGLLAIGATFWLGNKLMGRWAGLLAAGLLASTPGVFFYFVDANPYTILIFWSALSTGLMFTAIERNTWGSWVFYTVAVLGGLASHTLFIFYVGGQWLLFLYIRLFSPIKPSGLHWRGFWRKERRYFASSLVVLAIWFGWVTFYLSNKSYVNTPQIGRMMSFPTLVSMAGMIPGPLSYDLWPHGILFGIALAGGMLVLWRSDRETWIRLMLLWIPPVIGITLFVRATLIFISYKYALGVFPVTCLLAAGILKARQDNMPGIGGRIPWRLLLVGTICLCISAGTWRLAFSTPEYFSYNDWKSCVRYLEENAGARDTIWFEYEQSSFPFAFYYSRRDQIAFNPTGDHETEAEDLIRRQNQVAAQGGTVWVVLPDFQNRNPWIERFTRSVSRNKEEIARQLDLDLQSRCDFRLVSSRNFDRIRVYRITTR